VAPAPAHPVSSLADGHAGWLQRTNFAVTGVLYLAGAAGLAHAPRRVVGSRATPLLIAAAGAGLIGSGVFVTDPVSGFPPDSNDGTGGPSREGAPHNLCALRIFAAIPVAGLMSGRSFAKRGDGAWARYSRASAVLMATTVALFSAAFGQTPRLVAWGGLLQRASLIAGFGWLTALSLRARRALSGAGD
jgi:Protein of unknown function (DUF998)